MKPDERPDLSKKCSLVDFLLCSLGCLFFLLAPAMRATAQTPLVRGVDAVGLTVSDIDRSVDFYTRVLHFTKVGDEDFSGETYEHFEGVFGLHIREVRLKLGDEFLDLTEYLAPRGRPIPEDSASNDHWFQHVAIVVRDLDKAYAWLRKNNVKYGSSDPQTLPQWNKGAAGIKAFYFRDPDGHTLEIIQFPEGKGLAKWHRPGDDLFLGIDHTAIVVSHTDASLSFYRDELGMKVVGESENYGVEQEHLNNVFGAHLRITSLRAASGPGVEFHEYLSPLSGRPIPPDQRANDLASWQTKMRVLNVEQTAKALLGHASWVSSSVLEIQSGGARERAFIVRDPDGHAVALMEPVVAASREHRPD